MSHYTTWFERNLISSTGLELWNCGRLQDGVLGEGVMPNAEKSRHGRVQKTTYFCGQPLWWPEAVLLSINAVLASLFPAFLLKLQDVH